MHKLKCTAVILKSLFTDSGCNRSDSRWSRGRDAGKGELLDAFVVKSAVKAEHPCDPPGGATFIWPGSASLSASPGGRSRAPASSPRRQYGQQKNEREREVSLDQMWRTRKAVYSHEN